MLSFSASRAVLIALTGALILALPSDSLSADRPVVGKIRGTIRDSGNRPIPGLLVRLASRGESGTLRVTGTDEKGRYQFRDLPAGTYDVQITVDGAGPQRKEGIEVRPPFQNIVDFRLGIEGARPAGSSAAGGGAGAVTLLVDEGIVAAPVIVQGMLRDEEKRPVMEVSITLVSLEREETQQTFSSADGRFVLESVRPGKYRAVITSPGHVTLDVKSVEVPAGGLNVNLTLVDYPLNFRNGEENLLPPELPRPVPENTAAR
jgi:protocatechuate 3,4-dioxygenase beta subunit